MRAPHIYIVMLIIGLAPIFSLAQVDSIEIEEDLIESIIQGIEDGEEFEYNTIYEELSALRNNPIKINTCDEDDLKQIILLNDVQINDVLSYRATYGDFISLEELQALPSWDLHTIRTCLPFLTISSALDDYNLPITKMITGGKNEVYVKWRRVLEDQKGYHIENPDASHYEGDPNRLYIRFRHYYENKFKVGFTTEKDAGESLFSGSNPNGFDFYSGHIQLREYRSWLEDLIIGDYTVSLGQGLILHNDFGGSKSSYVMDLKKGGRVLKSYNSINEVNFFRGIATQLNFGGNVNATIFASSKKIDGSSFIDTLESETGLESFSSLITSGYHRTQSEISKKRTIGQQNAGGRLEYKGSDMKFGLNFLHTKFDKTFNRSVQLYNQFLFRGDQLTNMSVDYSYRYRNINFFGESARSDNDAYSHLMGVLIGLDRKVDLSLLYRNYSKDYQVITSNSFGETTGSNNEIGLYMGMIFRPHNYWTISTYADHWKHPWLRFRRDAPSSGKEYLIKVDHYRKRQYNFYVQYKYENKQINESSDENPIDLLGDIVLHRLRAHVGYVVTKGFEMRDRVEFSRVEKEGRSNNGFMIFHDIIYKPIGRPFSFTARYALFDTGNCDTNDCDNRIYAYENDLIYEFYIPFFQNRGKRYYINLRYNMTRDLTMEFRYARTVLKNQDVTGSGLDEIDGNIRTEVKAQVRYQF